MIKTKIYDGRDTYKEIEIPDIEDIDRIRVVINVFDEELEVIDKNHNHYKFSSYCGLSAPTFNHYRLGYELSDKRDIKKWLNFSPWKKKNMSVKRAKKYKKLWEPACSPDDFGTFVKPESWKDD